MLNKGFSCMLHDTSEQDQSDKKQKEQSIRLNKKAVVQHITLTVRGYHLTYARRKAGAKRRPSALCGGVIHRFYFPSRHPPRNLSAYAIQTIRVLPIPYTKVHIQSTPSNPSVPHSQSYSTNAPWTCHPLSSPSPVSGETPL